MSVARRVFASPKPTYGRTDTVCATGYGILQAVIEKSEDDAQTYFSMDMQFLKLVTAGFCDDFFMRLFMAPLCPLPPAPPAPRAESASGTPGSPEEGKVPQVPRVELRAAGPEIHISQEGLTSFEAFVL